MNCLTHRNKLGEIDRGNSATTGNYEAYAIMRVQPPNPLYPCGQGASNLLNYFF
jgi:hypothetical protein